MKTLRELVTEAHAGGVIYMGTLGYTMFRRGFGAALRTHGDWQLCEGQLRYYHGTGEVCVVTDEPQGRPDWPEDRDVRLGNARDGDRVRVFLPPKVEPIAQPLPLWDEIATLKAALADARGRADEERAMRMGAETRGKGHCDRADRFENGLLEISALPGDRVAGWLPAIREIVARTLEND